MRTSILGLLVLCACGTAKPPAAPVKPIGPVAAAPGASEATPAPVPAPAPPPPSMADACTGAIATPDDVARVAAAHLALTATPTADEQTCIDAAIAAAGALLVPGAPAQAPRYDRPATQATSLDLQYVYAELLWHDAEHTRDMRAAAGLWERAAVQFVVAARRATDRLRKEAAYAAVLAWKNALSVDPRPARPDPEGIKDYGVAPTPQEIPAREQQMLAAFADYLTLVKDPADPERAGMKFLMARIYARYYHADEALPIFADIIEHHLDHETAEYSINLTLDLLNRFQRYDEMVAWVDRLLADDKRAFLAAHPDLAEMVRRIKQQARHKTAELRARDGDFEGCGDLYVEIYNQEPDAERNDEVLYNAAVCYERAGATGASITLLDKVAKDYRHSRVAPRALQRVAMSYARIAQYDRAAERLEDYARRYGSEPDTETALSDAVYYRRALGDEDKVIADTELLVKRYPKKPVAAQASFALTEIYAARGHAALIAHLEKYLKTYARLGGPTAEIIAHVQLGEAYTKKKKPDLTVARTHFQTAAKLAERDHDLLPYWRVASSFYLAADVTDYERVISSRVPEWAAAAHARLGQLELDAKHPAAATEHFVACLDVATDHGIATDWTALCDREVARTDLARATPREWYAPATAVGGPWLE